MTAAKEEANEMISRLAAPAARRAAIEWLEQNDDVDDTTHGMISIAE